jgi:hypothetical protein
VRTLFDGPLRTLFDGLGGGAIAGALPPDPRGLALCGGPRMALMAAGRPGGRMERQGREALPIRYTPPPRRSGSLLSAAHILRGEIRVRRAFRSLHSL